MSAALIYSRKKCARIDIFMWQLCSVDQTERKMGCLALFGSGLELAVRFSIWSQMQQQQRQHHICIFSLLLFLMMMIFCLLSGWKCKYFIRSDQTIFFPSCNAAAARGKKKSATATTPYRSIIYIYALHDEHSHVRSLARALTLAHYVHFIALFFFSRCWIRFLLRTYKIYIIILSIYYYRIWFIWAGEGRRARRFVLSLCVSLLIRLISTFFTLDGVHSFGPCIVCIEEVHESPRGWSAHAL